MGIQGISIRSVVNTNNTHARSVIFGECNEGIVFVNNKHADPVGRFDAIIFIQNSNSIRVLKCNAGNDSHFHVFSIENGNLIVSNSGYGVGYYEAYHLSLKHYK